METNAAVLTGVDGAGVAAAAVAAGVAAGAAPAAPAASWLGKEFWSFRPEWDKWSTLTVALPHRLEVGGPWQQRTELVADQLVAEHHGQSSSSYLICEQSLLGARVEAEI